MNKLKLALVLVAIMTISACGSTQEKNNASGDTSGTAIDESNMIAQGYLMGTIRYSEAEGDCPYAIEVESDDYNYMLDPLNLEEAHKKDGHKVWFKFTPLRMPNRCEKASPVNLTEVQQRQ